MRQWERVGPPDEEGGAGEEEEFRADSSISSLFSGSTDDVSTSMVGEVKDEEQA